MPLCLYKAVSLNDSAAPNKTDFGSSKIDVYSLIGIYRVKCML